MPTIHIPRSNRRFDGNVPIGVNGVVRKIPVGVDYDATQGEVDALLAAGIPIAREVVPEGSILIPASYGSGLPFGVNGVFSTIIPGVPFVPTAAVLAALAEKNIPYRGASSGTPTPTPTPTPTYSLKPVGMNAGSYGMNSYGATWGLLDRSKTSTGFIRDDNGLPGPVNGSMHPTAIPAGRPFIRCLFNVEGIYGPADKQTYVYETTKLDEVSSFVDGDLEVLSDGVVAGKRRLVVKVKSAMATGGAGFFITLNCTSLPTPYVEGVDYYRFFRLDEEAELNSGKIWRDFYTARNQWGTIRSMDLQCINANVRYTLQTRSRLDTATWRIDDNNVDKQSFVGVPIEAIVSLANACNSNLWVCLPVGIDPAYAQWIGQYIAANLKAGLRCLVEYGNENWNPGFASYHALATYTPFVDGVEHSWGMSGYRGVQMIAEVLKGSGYSDKVVGAMLTQTVDPAVTAAMFVGADKAMAEWANTAHANYNADFAERFQYLNQVAPFAGGATYLASINSQSRSTNPAADKAMVESWAEDNANGGTWGIAQAFEQMRFGNKLTSGTYDTLAAADADWGAALAPFIARGQVSIAYEGGFHLNADTYWLDNDPMQTKVVKLFGDISYHPLAYQFYLDMRKKARDLGITYDSHLADISPKYAKVGIWGTIEHGYQAPTTPRHRALLDFNANPTAAPQLTVQLVTTGVYQVGANPITEIRIRGGIGLRKIVVTGLVEGRKLVSNYIKGVLTKEEAKLLTVTVTDEAGSSAQPVTEMQNVAPKPPGRRYIKMRIIAGAGYENPLSAGGYLPMNSEFIFENADGSVISMSGVTVTGDNNGNPNEMPSALIDGNPNTNWVGAGNKENALLFDFGAGIAVKPARIRMRDRPGSEPNASGDFEFLWTDNPATGDSIFRTQKLNGTGPGNAFFGNDGLYSGKYPSHEYVAVLSYA